MSTSSLPVAVVTGGTSGIGLAVAQDLAKDHQVYALGRNKESLAQLSLRQNIEAVEIDLLDFAAQRAFITSLAKINVLVHAAAISEQTTVENATPESVANAVRLVVSASEETQITEVNVRPRHDKAKR